MGGKCMKPLYVKKNGVVYKISGTGMPSIYPAANVEYDNTATSELQATDVQGAIDELSTRQGGVQSDWNENDTTELDYIKNKPENLVQDASYVHTDNNYDATAKGKVDSLGTASTKNVGVANGVAELDAAGKVPSSQLPSFVDDVIEVADHDHLPITGESGKIYVTLDTNKTYRWTGSGYAEISESLALGETSSTAYRGDRGKTAYDHSQDQNRVTTAVSSGLYKFGVTAQGHISGTSAVQKSDITALGIPAQDTIIKNTAYGTCDTAGDVKDKVATLSNATNWVLEVGTIVGVQFTYTNTYARQGSNKVTLNVNNTGAKEIRYNNDIWIGDVDTKCPTAFGEAGQTIYYMYDGTDWVWISHSKDNDTTYAFDGNEFRSEDGNNYFHGGSTNGNANNMTVNGHYYYRSNGPSTAIGASGNDGAMFVQAYDSDNVTQIAQNYETGNIFVRSKVNGSWTEWKKTEAIDKEIRDKADNTTTSISGNPISIADLKSAQIAVNPIITFEPIQDLHWQSKPYPAGGGKNKLKMTVASIKASNTSGTWSGNTYTISGLTCTILVDSANNVMGIRFTSSSAISSSVGFILSEMFTLPAGSYKLTSGRSVTTGYISAFGAYAYGEDTTLTLSSATEGRGVITIGSGFSGSVDFKPMIRLATESIDFAPYSNECPISGYDKIEVLGCKENLFDVDALRAGTIGSDGSYLPNFTSYRCTQYLLLKAGTYTATRNSATSWWKCYRYSYNGDKTPVGWVFNSQNSLSESFTLNVDMYVMMAFDYIPTESNQIQLEAGSATTYIPYHKTTDLSESLGQTVYGATWYPRIGKLRNTHKAVDMGSLSWTYYSSSTRPFFYTILSDASENATPNNSWCEIYPIVTDVFDKSMYWNGTQIRVFDYSYTDATAFTNAVSGKKLVYPLATPTEIQLTPHEIALSQGYNYISTNGTSISLAYHNGEIATHADVEQLAETVEKLQTKLNYHDYTVKGDGTTTWGDLLSSLRPIYESLSEDEKTFSKLIFRPESISGNECLSYCGAYWYSRMGLNGSSKDLWIDHASLGPGSSYTYYYQKHGDTFTDKTSERTTYSLSLRVFVEVGSSS